MPCNADYMNPGNLEKEISKVACILDELDGKINSNRHWEGYHPDVYGACSKQKADRMVAELCARLQEVKDVSSLSLEAQIWWRDHQRADKARIEAELEAQKRKKDRKELIAKLTPYERSLLGV